MSQFLNKRKYSYCFFNYVFFFLLLKNWLEWWEFLYTSFTGDIKPKVVSSYNMNWIEDVSHIFLRKFKTIWIKNKEKNINLKNRELFLSYIRPNTTHGSKKILPFNLNYFLKMWTSQHETLTIFFIAQKHSCV